MKAGDVYFNVSVDAEEGSLHLETWVITALRAGRAHAIEKTPHTWVKLSTKSGDYGWANAISGWNRRAFTAENGPPATWARTAAAAYTKALPDIDAAIKRLNKLRGRIAGQRTKARRKAP